MLHEALLPSVVLGTAARGAAVAAKAKAKVEAAEPVEAADQDEEKAAGPTQRPRLPEPREDNDGGGLSRLCGRLA